MSFLALEGIGKRFGATRVLDEVTADVAEGETLVLLGPSGSGKTTLLRIVAGFETPDAGVVRVAGETVNELAPARRNFGMVFQHYALFPHLSVRDNVAFGLAAQGARTEATRQRVDELLDLVELGALGERAIHEISGGQQQRVALARALAPGPRLLLLDEPLSNLDPTLRERTRAQLKALLHKVAMTAVWVTHEQQEAFDVGDRIALLDGGRLQQLGTARDLYERPATPFVAEFVGRANWLAGELDAADRVRLEAGARWPLASPAGTAGDRVTVMVRPEDCRLTEAVGDSVVGEVTHLRFAGHSTFVDVSTTSGERLTVMSAGEPPAPGSRVGVAPRDGRPSPRAYPPGGDG